jgi:hypothetical protein
VIIKLVDINKRLKALSESVSMTNNTIDSVYNMAVKTGKFSSIITCLEQWYRLPGRTIEERAYKAIALIDRLSESKASKYQIDRCVDIINEAIVLKFRDADSLQRSISSKLGWFNRKIKIEVGKSFGTSGVDDSIQNIINKISDIDNNTQANNSSTAVAADTGEINDVGADFVNMESAYLSILEQTTKMVHIDRILKNYDMISKRFNLDKVLIENYNGDNIQETVLSICNLIDTYNTSDTIKLNTTLETVWYGLSKFGYNIDLSTMFESACNYFMLKHDGANTCKLVLDATVITDPYKLGLSYIMEDPEVKDKFNNSIIGKTVEDSIFNFITKESVMITDNTKKPLVFIDAFNKFKKAGRDIEIGYLDMLETLFRNKESDIPNNIYTIVHYIKLYMVEYSNFSLEKVNEWMDFISDRFVEKEYSEEIARQLLFLLNDEKNRVESAVEGYVDRDVADRLSVFLRSLNRFIDNVEIYISNITGKSPDDIISIEKTEDDNKEELTEQDLQMLAYIPAILNELKVDEYIDIDSYLDRNISIIPNDILVEICKFNRDYAPLVDPEHVINLLENRLIAIKMGRVSSATITDKYSTMSTYNDCINILKEEQKNPVMTVEEAYAYIKAYNTINSVLVLIESSYNTYGSILETSFGNTLKMARERMAHAVANLGDKEKEASRSIDSAVNRFVEGLRRLFTTNQREAVIKGTICPSASQALKILLGATGLSAVGSVGTKAAAGAVAKAAAGAAAGTKTAAALTSAAKVLGAMKFPVLAIISILAFIICSKKFKNKERMMVLDEIDIELQMVDKYLELAERKEDLVAYKQLITIKRSLERDKQRIQYGMKVSGQKVIPVSDTIAGKSY